MSAALQLPTIWGASIYRERRRTEELEKPGKKTFAEQAGRSGGTSSGQPGLLQEAYGKHVAPLSLRFNADRQVSIHSERLGGAGMGIEPADPDF
jgi:hypothetical protein